MDTSSRRAFPLDSRAVWVEQQIVNSTILSRDNLVLGPGEYAPKIPDRHVSTPCIGKRSSADWYPGFKSNIRTPTPLSKGSPSRAISPQKAGGSLELRDFSTIHVPGDGRQPYDPKTLTCPTPGPYLAHTSVLRTLKHDGVYEVKETVPFGAGAELPFGERNPTKPALPDYDPNYDSAQLRPSTTLGSFSKDKRIYIPTMDDVKKDRQEKASGDHIDLQEPSVIRKSIRASTPKQPSVYEWRRSLVPLPKLKCRAPPVLTFDDSSYRSDRLRQPLSLTPKLINSEAKVHLFEKIAAIPRQHQSNSLVPKLELRQSQQQDDIYTKRLSMFS